MYNYIRSGAEHRDCFAFPVPLPTDHPLLLHHRLCINIRRDLHSNSHTFICGRSTWVPRRNPAAKRSHTGAETLTHPQYARRPSSRTVRMKSKSRRLPLCCHLSATHPHETRQFSLSWCCVVYLAPLRPRHRRRYCRWPPRVRSNLLRS